MAKATSIKSVTLALQGGGSHGAFTWGVLDRLLEEPALHIEGISGTSAGAMNAVVLADGFERGGREGARDALHRFWRAISKRSAWSPYRSGWRNPLGLHWSPLGHWFDFVARVSSPYQFNPSNINPLGDVLSETIDFERLRRCQAIKLYVCATNVLTSHMHIFTTDEISLEALLASACLPSLYQAVEVDGEYYWDGGFLGNPVLEPLVTECEASDIVIVQVNPGHRAEVPTTSADIIDRVNEITFNASLMREIRSIAAFSHLVAAGELSDTKLLRTYLHMVGGESVTQGLGLRSKMDTGWAFLGRLRDGGRRQADQWLAEHFDDLGRRSTLDFTEWTPRYGRYAADRTPLPPVKRER